MEDRVDKNMNVNVFSNIIISVTSPTIVFTYKLFVNGFTKTKFKRGLSQVTQIPMLRRWLTWDIYGFRVHKPKFVLRQPLKVAW